MKLLADFATSWEIHRSSLSSLEQAHLLEAFTYILNTLVNLESLKPGAIGKIGSGSEQAVSALEEAAKSEFIGVRMAAESALNKIRGQ